ncbi:hypothetical protein KY317_03370, partial [Candidatus Woesearchaeota archaeon]|nr:hypothetical protein [Candidatus Woesearchaeota archaeon]
MNKKIISLIIAVFLLVNIANVCAQNEVIFVDGTKEPAKEPSVPEKTPIGVESQLDTVEIVIDYNKNKQQDAGEPKITMPKIFYENIIRDRNGVFNADGDLVAQGVVWDIKTSQYTATKDEEIIGVFEFNKKGYIYKHYENGKPVYFNGRDAKGHHFEKIPIDYLKKININADDFSYDVGEKTFTYDEMNAKIDNHNSLIISRQNKIVSTTTVNTYTGVTATMDDKGNIEIRDSNGELLAGFKGQYDTSLGGYYSKRTEQGYFPNEYIPSHYEDQRSIIYEKDPVTGERKKVTTIKKNGDKNVELYESGNKRYSDTTYHANGDITVGYDPKSSGKFDYYSRTNPNGWIVYVTDSDKKYAYVEDEEGEGKEHKGRGDIVIYTRDEEDKLIFFKRYTEEELKDPKGNIPEMAAKAKKIIEENKVRTGRTAISKFFGAIMGVSDYSALSNALFKGETWKKYKEDVDKFFSQNYLGIDYLASLICERDFHRIGDYSVAAIETPTGLVQFIGSIQAEKSAPMPKQCPCAKDETCMGKVCYKGDRMQHEYFYKITYAVTAPSDIKLTPQRKEGSAVSFSVQLVGEKSHWLFVKNKQPYFYELENRESQSAVGEKAVIFYSSNNYNDIYVIFREKPRDGHGNIIDKIHN